MRQVRRPPQAVPRTRPASYRRYAVALGAAASGFMALLVIYGSVSLREGVVGVQDLAPGASSYENAQWSKELSKTELKKETDDEVACCPSLAVSVHINRCLRLIRDLGSSTMEMGLHISCSLRAGSVISYRHCYSKIT